MPKHLQQLQALAKHSELRATTGTTMVNQWNPEYLPLAFPSSIPRPDGGADFPLHPSKRRQEAHHADAHFVPFEPSEYMRSFPARVEAHVRGSWPLVALVRNHGVCTRNVRHMQPEIFCGRRVQKFLIFRLVSSDADEKVLYLNTEHSVDEAGLWIAFPRG